MWRAQLSVKQPRKLWGFDSLPAHHRSQYPNRLLRELTRGDGFSILDPDLGDKRLEQRLQAGSVVPRLNDRIPDSLKRAPVPAGGPEPALVADLRNLLPGRLRDGGDQLRKAVLEADRDRERASWLAHASTTLRL